jgi:hypothetical protein
MGAARRSGASYYPGTNLSILLFDRIREPPACVYACPIASFPFPFPARRRRLDLCQHFQKPLTSLLLCKQELLQTSSGCSVHGGS